MKCTKPSCSVKRGKWNQRLGSSVSLARGKHSIEATGRQQSGVHQRLAKAGEEFAHDPQPTTPWVNSRLHHSRREPKGCVRTLTDQPKKTKKAYLYWNRKALKDKRRSSLPLMDIGFLSTDENNRQATLSRSGHQAPANHCRPTQQYRTLTATASETKYLGQTWFPVVGLSPDEAKAIAVFANSTPGRLQIMRGEGKTLEFPSYSPQATNNLRVPNIKDDHIRETLADCWERTKDMEVPQFRDGECEVRQLWDEAVAEAMGWDAAELSRLRHQLHQEPHVRGPRVRAVRGRGGRRTGMGRGRQRGNGGVERQRMYSTTSGTEEDFRRR